MLFWLNVCHFIMAGALFLTVVFLLRQTPSRTQNLLLMMSVAVLLMILGYTIEINSLTADTALVGVKIGYIGKPFAVYFAFLFVVERYGYDAYIKKWHKYILLFFSTVVTLLVLTCTLHPLYYSSIDYTYEGGLFPHLVLGHGVFYNLYTALIIFYFAADTVIFIRERKKAKNNEERKQVLCIFGMIASGILGFILFLSGVTAGYDTTIPGCFVGIIFMLLLFYKHRIFDALAIVKEHAINASPNGIIVLDNGERVVYLNNVVKKAFPGIICRNNEKTIEDIRSYSSGKSIFSWSGRLFNIVEHPVTDNGRVFGSAIELYDITDSYLYSQRLEKDVRERTKDIRRIQRQVTVSFANIVEARDSDTGGHIRRTGCFVRRIADELRKNSPYSEYLTDEFVDMLEETTPLHDIGKITIPDRILLKPGRLTEDEFEIMKTHTVVGREMIEKTMRGVESDKYVTMAENIALYHHERWDGRGYPEGLSGEDIPLCARIMSIADVYDALRSERCYKPPFTKERACEIMRENSGTQFDPVIVNAFIAVADEVESEALLQE